MGICGKMGTLIYEYLKNSNEIVGIDKIQHKDVPTYKGLMEIENIDILMGRGIGKTKKEAEQNAAKAALKKEAK